MSSVRDFIDLIDQDNNLDAQTVFDNELQTRIQQSLNNKREEVAGTFVSDDIEESTILEAKFKKMRKKGKPSTDWQKNMGEKLKTAAGSLMTFNSDGTIKMDVEPLMDARYQETTAAVELVDGIVKQYVKGMTFNKSTYDGVKHTDDDGNIWEFGTAPFGRKTKYVITIKPPKTSKD